MIRAPRLLIGLGLALGLAAGPAVGADLRDLYFGEALYHAYQGQYFEALQRLDTELAQYHGLDEPRLDTLHYHINDAEFIQRSEEHTSELQSPYDLVCRLLLEKKKKNKI